MQYLYNYDSSLGVVDCNSMYEIRVMLEIENEEARKEKGEGHGRSTFDLLLGQLDYSQYDNRQDFQYFGTWVNLLTFHYLNYCEGDITFIKFDSLLELLTYISKYWESGQFIHIDGIPRSFEYYNNQELLKLDDVKAIILKESNRINLLNQSNN